MLVVENHYWRYLPQCLPNPQTIFKLLMRQLEHRVCSYLVPTPYSDQLYPSRRLSCKFYDKNNSPIDYEEGLPGYDWSDSTILFAIKQYLERVFEEHFDYALVHVYRNGEDYINWHRDKEASNTAIASVSLGATRKFRFKSRNRKAGWDNEFSMESGSVVFMKIGCNQVNLHCVPKEKKVVNPRINITFRQWQDNSPGY